MYQYCNPNQFTPGGWLYDQLKIQAKGLSGNLHKVWPDVRDSAWIGGDKDGWERVPYWLDGFIPLAWLLRDKELMAVAEKYVNGILDRQEEDGWICPCSYDKRTEYDVWAYFLIGKVLALYLDFTSDARTEKALYHSMKCLYDWLADGRIVIKEWGKFRTFECYIPLLKLYKAHKEEWILDMARILRCQGADYSDYKKDWVRPLNRWTKYTHIVNLCMMFKSDALYAELTGEKVTDRAEELWAILERYNGTTVGTFTGDECLAGIGNNHGTELCAVVELMYTCEVMYALTGNTLWLDRLEKAAFNALPATLSDDMWTHQYDQMVNQIACVRFPGKSFFRTNGSGAHLFGLEPEFGCCTANFSQGWPKLAMSVYAKSEDALIATMMLPGQLVTIIDGVAVKIVCQTEYPFRLDGRYTIKTGAPVNFTFKLRIPQFAKGVSVTGACVDKDSLCNQNDNYITLKRTWQGENEINVTFFDTPHFVNRPHDLAVVEYGALVFSLPIETEYKMREYEQNGVVRKFPYCDYELTPKSEWRYGFAATELSLKENHGDAIPFSSKAARICLKAKLARVDWEMAEGYEAVANEVPRGRNALSKAEEATLVPYGCAKLRMTELPFVK